MSRISLESLLAHNHSITITVLNRKLKVCARCSGAVVGFTLLLSSTFILDYSFFLSLHAAHQLLLCVALVFPAILDWTTQTWKLRNSNNTLRFSTGFLEGSAVVFLQLSAFPLIQKIFILLLIGGLVLNAGFLGGKLRKQAG